MVNRCSRARRAKGLESVERSAGVAVDSIHLLGPEAFDGTRLRREGTWAVAFLADWCPFCRSFEPGFAKEASRGGASFAVADLSLEENPLWDRFRVDVVPTVIVFRDGLEVLRLNGQSGYGLDAGDLRSMRATLSGSPPHAPDGRE